MNYNEEKLTDYFVNIGVTSKDLSCPEVALKKVSAHDSYLQPMHMRHIESLQAVEMLTGQTGQRQRELDDMRRSDIAEQQQQRNEENLLIQNNWKKRGQV